MSLNSTGVARRRRGPALEEALLDAAWTELTERGYDELTIDGVAVRAGTSRAVLYRRWPNKQELVLAAVAHEVAKDVVVAPDTGSLRGDAIALLRQANKVRVGLVVPLLTRLGGFYQQTGSSLADLETLVRGRRDAALDQVIQRAIDRGEIEPDQLTERIARLPVDLFRYEVLMTLRPLPDEAIEEIVDTVWLPLLERRSGS
ncbi:MULTISPECIES: TetR/AcrR family transcriptional regulator [Mycobacterium]|jgi:AcrR family transcriptional regulator|uniref:TetR family transcriptional regulator n=1 Tax=Mycobacterium paraintracellulare TaxID=1138383 RepID=A0ABN6AUQ1_9MYCO|nr:MULTISPECIES: TetR/AcrR family transcriptional regulator [Mycobacterium]MCA2251512.1 TetR/AcrR family transcriptional regulator [Mycobacterium intracellulare]MCA2360007.1 TetR/AcrR family transcriptional regulator [Mycobacterium intracellulare]MCA2369361.1 TetR/AcrR family transcriptional regulator [Mycobacterium intracellulare]UGT98653.1 TetR/AcrR family transcriptional regulator [Mycobacterium intracellulare]UQB94489.1 TetR/AcrR family transcriptional regulator [Mycobacterium intracellula